MQNIIFNFSLQTRKQINSYLDGREDEKLSQTQRSRRFVNQLKSIFFSDLFIYFVYLRMLFPSKISHKLHKNLMNTEKFQPQKYIHDEYGCSETKIHSETQRLNLTDDSRTSQNEEKQRLVRRFFELKSIQAEMNHKFMKYFDKLQKQLMIKETNNVQLCGQISKVKGQIQQTRGDIKKIKAYAMSNHIDLLKENEHGKQKNMERKRGNYGLRRCWDECNL